jgi:cell division protein FtsB
LNPARFCDSLPAMQDRSDKIRHPREGLVKAAAIAVLLVVAGLALAGPAGVLAWTENRHQLERTEAEIARLSAERDVLRNRVDLLNPRNADPDLVGELLRKNLNVAHPDEIVVARP